MIVPARDCESTLARTLEALAGQRAPAVEVEVVVVDNGSRDGTGRLAEEHPAVDAVIRRERGEGPGAARNAGAQAARGDLLAFTDADCVPEPGWLSAGLEALKRADLVQGEVRPVDDVEVGPFDRTVWATRPNGLFETANLFVRREAFERVGGFPAGLEPEGEAPFGEDVLFGWATVRAGARAAFSQEAVVRHAVTPRGAGGFVAERARLGLFAALVARVPELRETFLWRRTFVSARSAAFDAAVAGALLAAARRRPAALAATLPYLAVTARDAAPWGPRAAWKVAVAGVAADAAGAASLLAGSLRARRPVL